MKDTKDNSPQVVFSGNIMEATMIKTFLENAEIKAFLKDEFMGTLVPFYTSPGGSGSVKVIVSYSDSEKANLLVADYLDNLKK